MDLKVVKDITHATACDRLGLEHHVGEPTEEIPQRGSKPCRQVGPCFVADEVECIELLLAGLYRETLPRHAPRGRKRGHKTSALGVLLRGRRPPRPHGPRSAPEGAMDLSRVPNGS